MENAGYNLSREVLRLAYAQDDEDEIQVLGLVGPGNNGGDTLVALAHLAGKGWKARAYLIHRKTAGDNLIKQLEDAGGETCQAEKDENFQQLQAFLESADVVLDGVLGTGFNYRLKGKSGRFWRLFRGLSPGWNGLLISLRWIARLEWIVIVVRLLHKRSSRGDCHHGCG